MSEVIDLLPFPLHVPCLPAVLSLEELPSVSSLEVLWWDAGGVELARRAEVWGSVVDVDVYEHEGGREELEKSNETHRSVGHRACSARSNERRRGGKERREGDAVTLTARSATAKPETKRDKERSFLQGSGARTSRHVREGEQASVERGTRTERTRSTRLFVDVLIFNIM